MAPFPTHLSPILSHRCGRTVQAHSTFGCTEACIFDSSVAQGCIGVHEIVCYFPALYSGIVLLTDHSLLRSSFAAILMRIVYGVELVEENDEYFHMIEEIAAVTTEISVPGNFPVEAVPALCYLPSWAPGGGFKKYAADTKVLLLHTVDKLFRGALDNIVRCSTLCIIWQGNALTNKRIIAH